MPSCCLLELGSNSLECPRAVEPPSVVEAEPASRSFWSIPEYEPAVFDQILEYEQFFVKFYCTVE